VQNVFTRSLESGDRQKAMKRLRVPPLGEKVGTINQSCTFRVVQVIKSLQDPLEVGNNLPGISDNSNICLICSAESDKWFYKLCRPRRFLETM